MSFRFFWILALLTFSASAVDRRVTIEGVERVRRAGYSSVIELVKFELKYGRKESALRKLSMHLKNNPQDISSYILMSDLLEEQDPYLAEQALRRGLEFNPDSPDLMARLQERQEDRQAELNAVRAELMQSDFRAPILDLKTVIPSPSKENAKDPQKAPEGLNLSLLMRLRALDSLLGRWLSAGRKAEDFKLESLRSMQWLTISFRTEDLEPLKVDGKHVVSSCCGTASEVEKRLKPYLQALKLVDESKKAEAISLLEGIESPRFEEQELLYRLYQEEKREDQALMLLKSMNPLPRDSQLQLELADYFWSVNDSKRAGALYRELLGSVYDTHARERLRLLRGGANQRLRELLNSQLQDLSEENAEQE